MPEKKFLTRDDILKAQDIRIEELDVPEWGGTLFIKSLNGEERDQLESSLIEMDVKKGQPKRMKTEALRSSLAALSICDKDGNKLFSIHDIRALAKKSASALDRVAFKAQEMAGISEDGIKKLTSELKKDPAEDLPSG